MKHSKNYEKVKRYYTNYVNGVYPMWSLKMTWHAVGKWITEEEYKEITGLEYTSQEPKNPGEE